MIPQLKFILLLLLFASLCISLSSQPYYFRHYQVENGLSNNTINYISQDSKGFMWFASKDGLNRFDGLHFKVFRVNNNQPELNLRKNYIYDFFSGKDGTMLVGTGSGFYKYDPLNETLVPVIDSLRNIYNLLPDHKGNIWFLSNQDVYRLNTETKTLTHFNPSKFFYGTAICLDELNNIWISTTEGYLKRYDDHTGQFSSYDVFSHSPKPNSKWIQKIHAGKNNTLFVGTTSQGLKLFDINTLTYRDLLTNNDDGTNIYVRDIMRNTTDEYWFATESGIFIYNLITGKFINLRKKFTDPYSINDNAVYALCKDREGGIWAGTFFGGINYYAKQNAAFKKYFPDNTPNTISGNAVRCICEDKLGNLWVGTEDRGLNKIDKKTGNITSFMPKGHKSSIAYSNIHGLLADGDKLWIGTFENGIDVMEINTGKVIQHYSAGPGEYQIKSNFPLSFLKTSAGKILAATSNGLFYYDAARDGFTRVPQVPEQHFFGTVMQDHEKTIWSGTSDNGIFWFNPVTGQQGHLQNNISDLNSLSNNSVNCILEDNNHFIWFATEGGGICRLSPDRKKFNTLTTAGGLPSNFIFAIQQDDNGLMWVSTSKGLVSMQTDFSNLTVYTTANGLLNDQFNYNSAFKDEEGRLYFGSVKGMVSFKPKDLAPGNFVPPLYITGFQVFNEELKIGHEKNGLNRSIVYTDKVTLPHEMSSISIDFAALSYLSPSMIEYRYTMEGLDKEWIKLKANRKVYYTNLTPGRYVFKLKAVTNGIETANGKTLVIVILPPWWATPFTYVVYTLLAGILLYYIVSTYHRRQLNKKEKEIYESKIEFFTNVAHEIRTPLTLIKGPVENLMEREHDLPDLSEDLACLDRNTNRLMDLVTQILDFRQTEIKGFSLDMERVNIKDVLEECFLSFGILAKKKHLDFTLNMPPTDLFAQADKEALYKIITNLIGNAVKYSDGLVQVTLLEDSQTRENFSIIFENDGHIITPEMEEKIFQPFYRLKENHEQKGTGIGLTLARSLTELHQGKLQLQFAGKSVNTFVLSLPYKPA